MRAARYFFNHRFLFPFSTQKTKTLNIEQNDEKQNNENIFSLNFKIHINSIRISQSFILSVIHLLIHSLVHTTSQVNSLLPIKQLFRSLINVDTRYNTFFHVTYSSSPKTTKNSSSNSSSYFKYNSNNNNKNNISTNMQVIFIIINSSNRNNISMLTTSLSSHSISNYKCNYHYHL